jgi:hypothetical protein
MIKKKYKIYSILQLLIKLKIFAVFFLAGLPTYKNIIIKILITPLFFFFNVFNLINKWNRKYFTLIYNI